MASAFAGTRKRSTGGGGGDFDVPAAETHEARIVAMVAMGTHMESYKGEEPKPRQKVYLAFEVDEQMPGSKYNFVIGKDYTYSFHEKAGLVKLADAILGVQDDIDFGKLLGQPCSVTVVHKEREGLTEDGKPRKPIAIIDEVGAVPSKYREKVFKPTRTPFLWTLRDDLGALPDWLPYFYGRPLAEVIAECEEMAGTRKALPNRAARDAQRVTIQEAMAAQADEAPF